MDTLTKAKGEGSPRSDWFMGGGEMGERIRSFDWSKTPLGPVESWSPALRTMVRILLANRFPHILWWGPQYIQFYNDPYRPIPGAKHPEKALGRPASECWAEIWHVIGPLIDTPFNGGPATWDEDILLEVNRHGFVEETHFTIAYSPVPDEGAPRGIGGVLATVHEITGKVVGERRVVALRDLGARVGEAKTAEEACRIAAETLAAHDKDVPFVLLYLIDADGTRARLAGAAGVEVGQDISPLVVDLGAAQERGWPLAEARQREAMQVVERLDQQFAAVPLGPWSDPPHTAVVVPIPSNKAHAPAGLMVAGVSARLQWDQYYRDFLELVKAQVAGGISNARAYEEERKRAEALAELDRAKTAFFSNVSHEFRTPLTLLLGPIEDLLHTDDAHVSATAKGQLEVVHRNSLRLLRLVNTLLDFARIEAGRARANYQPTDLAAFTAELASAFRSACERAGLTLLVHCPPLPEAVYVDRDMWEKIVLNLVSNAFKFTLDGAIEVRLGAVDRRARLTVRDTGVGIPAEELPRMFERFHRVRHTQGRTHEGTGIGLALVQELVKLHGGDVRVESVLGEGSRFTVTLPFGASHLDPERIGVESGLASTATGSAAFVEEALRWLPGAEPGKPVLLRTVGESPEPLGGGSGEAQPHGPRPRLVWADDNADMRDYVCRLLSERFAVEAVADGQAALEAARRQPPDLVLSDVMMPRLDGMGLLRELRADPHLRQVPVILLSARSGEEARVEGIEAGADDYLIKPFSARELVARVETHAKIARMRREAEAALRDTLRSLTESEWRYRTIGEMIPFGVWMLDAEGQIVHLSDCFLEMLGQTLEEHRREWPSRIHPDDYDRIVGGLPTWLERGQPWENEYRIRDQAGNYRALLSRGIPLRDDQGRVSCWVGINLDLTERERAEEALRDADRRKDEFLATLAHELRNPLAPIRNAVDILKLYDSPDPNVQTARDMIDRQVQHLVRLIDDLLDVSRISRGTLTLRRERVELAVVVERALEAIRPEVAGAGHDLMVALPPEPIALDADPVRLAQVFVNLLHNACKYTEPGGHIRFAAERDGADVVVTVQDTGIGFAPEYRPRLFKMFSQATSALERSQGGLGIGLALVRSLVELHGGCVEAHSDGPGMGSEFSVRLPVLTERPAPQPPLSENLNDVKNVTARRILVVDDNRISARSLAMLLRLNGHEVETAHDGLEAVQKAETYQPEVILLDIGLPKLNGYDACQAIRAQPWGQSIVLVAVTGWGQDDDRRKAHEVGFDAHLVKPVARAALMALLASLLPEQGGEPTTC